MFRIGDIVGQIKLKNTYDDYVFKVIGDLLERQKDTRVASARGKTRRANATYKIKQKMPTLEEYAELKKKRFTVSAADLMSEAYGEIQSLAEEMREWYDNAGDNLQQGDKFQTISDSADALENISEQDSVTLMTEEVEVYYLPSLKVTSRADRASEAAAQLHAVSEALIEFCDEHDEKADPKNEKKDVAYAYQELRDIADQCEEDAGTVENVEFPGMYG